MKKKFLDETGLIHFYAGIKQLFNGYLPLTGGVITGNITASNFIGNASTASKLTTSRTINGTNFDGSANITTTNWGTSRNIGIVNSDGTGTAIPVSVNGSSNINLKLPATIKASLTGNASTATTLATARTINGTSFNGSANITTSNWGTARNITIKDATAAHSGNSTSVNGSTDITLKLPATITASLSGNASTASALATSRTIALSGDAKASGSFNGTGNLTLSTTIEQISAIDDRDVKPSVTSKSKLSLYFAAKGGLTSETADSDWHDLLVLNSYTNTSGGNVNALAFDKSTKAIYHYQAGQDATSWGTPEQIAYTTSTVSKATSDSAGQQINTTYIKGLSISGKTITYTKGNGATGTLTTQDTTYPVASTTANGLMSSEDKTKLNGITAGADSVSFTRSLTSGTKIGTITINGTGTDLYCQTNTDTNTKMTQTITTSNANYPLLLAPSGQSATTTTTGYFDSGVTLNPSTNTISANINGTAAKATADGNGNNIVNTYAKKADGNPIGAIILFPSNTLPTNYLSCNGQSLSRTEYAELFAVIGTTYGSADNTHFNLPNLQQRVPVGKSSTSPYNTLGNTGGEETHTLNTKEMPYHKHEGLTWGTESYITLNGGSSRGYNLSYSGGNGGLFTSIHTAFAGESKPHNNMQPYIVLNYIIKVK